MAAGSDHDRIDDDIRRLVLFQFIGDDADCFRYTDHADFDGVDVDIFKDRIDLRSNEVRRDVHIAAHALGVLGNDGRNDIQGKAAMGTKSLAIRSGTGSARSRSVPAMDNTCFIMSTTSNLFFIRRSQNFKAFGWT